MAEKTKAEKQAEDEAEALEKVVNVQAADKVQQAEAAAKGLPSVPADHVTISYIPDPDAEPGNPPATTKK